MLSDKLFNEMMQDFQNIAMAAGELLRARCKDLGINDMIAFIFLREVCTIYLELLQEDMSDLQLDTYKALGGNDY